MATGFLIQTPDGQTKQVPFDQASQYVDPQQLSAWQQHIGLPTQQLEQGGLDISGKQIQNEVAGSTKAANITSTNANAAVDSATVDPKIQSTFAGAVQEQQKADQVNMIKNSQAIFERSKGKDRHVSPDVYNSQLEQAVKVGINPDEFAQTFANYLNPNNVWYNTPDAISIRQNLPTLAQVVKSYADLDKSGQAGPELQKWKNVPGVGDIIYQHLASNAIAHDQLKSQATAKALKPAGAGAGSTIRGSVTELGYATSLLPDAKDTRTTANEKIARLDKYLKDNYSTSLDNWLGGAD